MRVWKRATGVLKDKNSIWAAKLSIRKGGWRNPDLETVVIKATSHDEECIDGKNVQRVFKWLRTSPTLYLKPLVWALSIRMQKTRSWVVALKGLMLIHGIFCIHDLPVMGRLPFDLSNFTDAHLNPAKASAFNLFVRSYFAYLDQRSTLYYNMSSGSDDEVKLRQKKKIIKGNYKEEEEVVEVSSSTLMEELDKLQKLQAMIDMLLQIKPRTTTINMNNNNNNNANAGGLILEAMDCVIVEVFDLYSKFCNKIAGVLLRIYDVCGKMEASIGLKVLRKASAQGDELSLYFEFCRDIGVLNASQCPKIQRISQEDIEDLERIISISGASSAKKLGLEEDKAIVVVRDYSTSTATINLQQHKESENGLITVITHQWEVFDDDDMMVGGVNGNSTSVFNGETTYTIDTTINNPFQESYSLVPYLPVQNQVLPDLISL